MVQDGMAIDCLIVGAGHEFSFHDIRQPQFRTYGFQSVQQRSANTRMEYAAANPLVVTSGPSAEVRHTPRGGIAYIGSHAGRFFLKIGFPIIGP